MKKVIDWGKTLSNGLYWWTNNKNKVSNDDLEESEFDWYVFIHAPDSLNLSLIDYIGN